jgi:hypothetical protein
MLNTSSVDCLGPGNLTVGTKSRPFLGGPNLSDRAMRQSRQRTHRPDLLIGTDAPDRSSDGTNVLSLDLPLSRACRIAAGLMSGRLTPYPTITRRSNYRKTIITHRDKYVFQGYYSC